MNEPTRLTKSEIARGWLRKHEKTSDHQLHLCSDACHYIIALLDELDALRKVEKAAMAFKKNALHGYRCDGGDQVSECRCGVTKFIDALGDLTRLRAEGEGDRLAGICDGRNCEHVVVVFDDDAPTEQEE